MEASELRRATLERKDRDELNTIAEALGEKPSSRARKAEVVDLILKAAGVDEAAAPESDAESAEPEPKDKGAKKPRGPKGGKSDGDAKNDGADNGDQQSFDPFDEARDNDNGDSKDRDDQPEAGNRRRRRRGRDRGEDPGQWDGEPSPVEGFLDLRDEGYGFLRTNGAVPSKADAYVSVKQVRQFELRSGDNVSGTSRPAGRNEKNPALVSVDRVNDRDPSTAVGRPNFDDLAPRHPDERISLDHVASPAARIVDVLSPLGKGQRGLLVSPPKAGKTTLLKQMAAAIEANHPEIKLLVLLIDERPEEIHDLQTGLERGEVIASAFDRPAEEHTALAEQTMHRAQRMVEYGDDVCVLIDGVSRLVRSYNLVVQASGRTLPGGLDAAALYPPKRLLGTARNVEGSGSLTVLATMQTETGSAIDEVIVEEFAGTANMEITLDRLLAEQRIYPAISIATTATRHEDLLYTSDELATVAALRQSLHTMGDEVGNRAGTLALIDRVGAFDDNAAFLAQAASDKAFSASDKAFSASDKAFSG